MKLKWGCLGLRGGPRCGQERGSHSLLCPLAPSQVGRGWLSALWACAGPPWREAAPVSPPSTQAPCSSRLWASMGKSGAGRELCSDLEAAAKAVAGAGQLHFAGTVDGATRTRGGGCWPGNSCRVGVGCSWPGVLGREPVQGGCESGQSSQARAGPLPKASGAGQIWLGGVSSLGFLRRKEGVNWPDEG